MNASGIRWLDGWNTQECVFPSPASGDWQGAPGRVLRAADGALALNFAPSRWLLIGQAEAWRTAVLTAGALVFDTGGKWRLLEIPGAHAAIHTALDVQSTLEGRECAAAVMFDTPVVIARAAARDMLLLGVPASYAASFGHSLENWA
jgi:hypothetical protein